MALTDLAVITGGDSWEALVGALDTYLHIYLSTNLSTNVSTQAHGAVVDTAMDGDVSGDLTYDPLGGLQVVRGLLLDAHFHQKGRQVGGEGGWQDDDSSDAGARGGWRGWPRTRARGERWGWTRTRRWSAQTWPPAAG